MYLQKVYFSNSAYLTSADGIQISIWKLTKRHSKDFLKIKKILHFYFQFNVSLMQAMFSFLLCVYIKIKPKLFKCCSQLFSLVKCTFLSVKPRCNYFCNYVISSAQTKRSFLYLLPVILRLSTWTQINLQSSHAVLLLLQQKWLFTGNFQQKKLKQMELIFFMMQRRVLSSSTLLLIIKVLSTAKQSHREHLRFPSNITYYTWKVKCSFLCA